MKHAAFLFQVTAPESPSNRNLSYQTTLLPSVSAYSTAVTLDHKANRAEYLLRTVLGPTQVYGSNRDQENEISLPSFRATASQCIIPYVEHARMRHVKTAFVA